MPIVSITIICSGKTRESFLKAGVAEYLKRIAPYMDITLEEVQDERTPDHESPGLVAEYRRREGLRLMERAGKDDMRIVLDPLGEMWSSEEVSTCIRDASLTGRHRIAFFIGGVYGHSPEMIHQADRVVSFSRMTFTHQMIRLMLLEQLYRAARIARNEPYHR